MEKPAISAPAAAPFSFPEQKEGGPANGRGEGGGATAGETGMKPATAGPGDRRGQPLTPAAVAALDALTRLAAVLAVEPWTTPAHQTILADWKTAAKRVAEAGRDVGEFLEGLQAWGQRWRDMSQAKPASVSPAP